MTGFAREDGGYDAFSWRWEVRSVNGRGLDVRLRLPSGLEGFEAQARDLTGKRLKRGNVSINLSLTQSPGITDYRLNEALLQRLVAISEEVAAKTGADAPRVDGLLRLKGVLEAEEPEESEEARTARTEELAESLNQVLTKIVAARAEEGARLEIVLGSILDEIAQLTEKARALAAAQPEAIRDRLTAQISELLDHSPRIADDRLAQEAAVLVGKADVREELDRLAAHISQGRELLAAGGPVGRRLDFLCQEFNREANTLCSKAQDLELTRTGLALKAAIEQFREQVQNIE
jgi:uncharacterized protein (TIGR00255 family)